MVNSEMLITNLLSILQLIDAMPSPTALRSPLSPKGARGDRKAEGAPRSACRGGEGVHRSPSYAPASRCGFTIHHSLFTILPEVQIL